MTTTGQSDDRLLFLLQTVEKEGRHLIGTTGRLDSDTERATHLFVKRIASQYDMAGAILFGSRARQNHTAG